MLFILTHLAIKIVRVFSEHEIFREEIRSLEMVKLKMSERIRELEAEMRDLKEKRNQEESSEEQVKENL